MEILNEDCLNTMRRMTDESVDLIVTSPPYDNLRTYDGIIEQNNGNFNGYSFNFEGIAQEIYRIIKKGGVVVWIVGDAVIAGSESGNSFRQALYFKSLGFNLHDTMIYEKAGMKFPDKNRYSQIFEYMFVFSKGKPKTVNLLKDRKNKWAGHTDWGRSGYRLNTGEIAKKKEKRIYANYGTRFNIWRYSSGFGFSTKDKIAFNHPATFPEDLARDHILSWSNKGDLVYDPFCGSGTTAKQAVLTERRFMGSEINKDYHALSLQRMEKVSILF